MATTQGNGLNETTYLTVPITTSVSKKQKPAKNGKAGDELSSYQALGQSISTFFLSTVNASQADISTAMRNLGHRPLSSDTSSPASSDFSSSCSTLGCVEDEPVASKPAPRRKSSSKFSGSSYTLRDFSAFDAVETLLLQYGTASHMGVRDPSYTFFVNESRTGALYYKLLDKVAVITGDPLCDTTQYSSLLDDFRSFCKAHSWNIAIMAASSNLTALAKEKKWITMRFGVEKSINTMTNPLLLGKGGKRTVAKCKQLLKSGLTVQLYCPSYQNDPKLELEIKRVYDDWRSLRNTSKEPQAFMTVFDMLALPRLMTFLYITDPTKPNTILGLAALRKVTNNGFHIDPLIASPSAPKGTTDLLLFSAISFSNIAGISKLSLGFEPLQELDNITGMPSILAKATTKIHRKMWEDLPLGGKKAFHERWHADEELDEDLFIVFPEGMPGVREMVAMVHFANIGVRGMVGRKMRKTKEKEKEKGKQGDD